MADNITLNTGSGGATIAADDISSVWYQRMKLTDGTADSTTPINAGNGTNGNALRVTIASDSTGVIGVTDNSGSLTVDNAGTFAVQAAQSGTWTVQPGNTANTTAWKVDGSAVTQPVSYATTGSGNATGALRVELANNGTGLISTVSTVTSVTAIGTSVTPGTSAAHLGKAEDAAASSGDTGVFALGVRSDTLATAPASADGDYSQMSVDDLGRTLVTEAPLGVMLRGTATTTGTSDTSLISAPGASLKIYVKAIQVVNTGSTTALITIKDGSGGSTLGYTIAPAGGGSNVEFPIPLVLTANTALYFAAGSSSTTVYVSAQGYKAK